MSTTSSKELQEFAKFVNDKLANGAVDLSPEEAVDEWRELYSDPIELAESVAAVREALADMEAGDRGMPLEEFDADFRARHQLPPRG